MINWYPAISKNDICVIQRLAQANLLPTVDSVYYFTTRGEIARDLKKDIRACSEEDCRKALEMTGVKNGDYKAIPIEPGCSMHIYYVPESVLERLNVQRPGWGIGTKSWAATLRRQEEKAIKTLRSLD